MASAKLPRNPAPLQATDTPPCWIGTTCQSLTGRQPILTAATQPWTDDSAVKIGCGVPLPESKFDGDNGVRHRSDLDKRVQCDGNEQRLDNASWKGEPLTRRMKIKERAWVPMIAVTSF